MDKILNICCVLYTVHCTAIRHTTSSEYLDFVNKDFQLEEFGIENVKWRILVLQLNFTIFQM